MGPRAALGARKFGTTTMRKMLSITLAAALVAATTGSAMAHPARFPHRHDRHGHIVRVNPPVHHYRRDNNNGAAVVFGLLALGTIAALAANNNRNDNYGYDDGYYGDSGYGYNSPYNYPPPAPYYGRR